MSTKQSKAYLEDVLDILKPHRQKEETLNRLFLKHLHARRAEYGDDFVNCAPWLKKNIEVTLEQISLERLAELVDPRTKEPYRADTPVVIVRYCGRDCLIDGGKRISKWQRENVTGSRPAYVVTVLDE